MKKNVLFLMLSSLLLLSVSCTTDSTEFDEGNGEAVRMKKEAASPILLFLKNRMIC